MNIIKLDSINTGINLNGDLFPVMTNDAYDFSAPHQNVKDQPPEWWLKLSGNDFQIAIRISEIIALME